MAILAQTRANIDSYAKGKSWLWHVPLWLFGLFLFVKMLDVNLIDPLPVVLQIPHAFDFMLHEFAHIFAGWMPSIFTALAGSASELLLGLLLVAGAFFFKNYFASLFCFLWLMLACMSVGSYMADAVPQNIPLVSLGGALAGSEQTIHDWNFIFGKLGLLESSAFIGGATKGLGIASGVFGLIFSAWIMYKMAAASHAGPAKERMTAEELQRLKASVRSNSPSSGAANESAKNQLYPTPVKGTFAETGKKSPPDLDTKNYS